MTLRKITKRAKEPRTYVLQVRLTESERRCLETDAGADGRGAAVRSRREILQAREYVERDNTVAEACP